MLTIQVECEALVKLMLLVRFSDKRLSLAESDVFDSLIQKMDWQNVINADSYIQEALPMVRHALQHDTALDDFITVQCDVFADESKPFVIDKLSAIMHADGAVAAELALMHHITSALG